MRCSCCGCCPDRLRRLCFFRIQHRCFCFQSADDSAGSGQLLCVLAAVLHVHDALKAIAGAGASLAAHQHDLAVVAADLRPVGELAGEHLLELIDGFESIVDVKDSSKYAQELTATGAVISAVEANPLAIGYASLSAVGDTVAMVTVEGVECSEDTVKDGSYKIQRPFVFVTNKSVTLSEQAQAFVDFASSKDAADLIRTAGAVPVNE